MGKRDRPRNKKTPSSHPAYEALAEELVEEYSPGRHQQTSNRLSKQVRKEIDEHLQLRTTPITWGVPCDEQMYTMFFTNFVRLGFMPWDSFITTENTYLPKARNAIHKGYLELNDTPYLMMLDSDVLPPLDVVKRLMAHDKHLVGGWYKNKNLLANPNPHPIVYDWGPARDKDGKPFGDEGFIARKSPGKGLERVAGAGAGVWLMARELAEKLGPEPYSMHTATEDFVLCKKITELGYSIFIDWSVECAHLGVGFV